MLNRTRVVRSARHARLSESQGPLDRTIVQIQDSPQIQVHPRGDGRQGSVIGQTLSPVLSEILGHRRGMLGRQVDSAKRTGRIPASSPDPAPLPAKEVLLV